LTSPVSGISPYAQKATIGRFLGFQALAPGLSTSACSCVTSGDWCWIKNGRCRSSTSTLSTCSSVSRRESCCLIVSTTTVISRVRAALPRFLAELERTGIADVDLNDDQESSAMRPRLRSIHVTSCLVYPIENGRPPGFYVHPEATDLWVGGGDEVRLFCEQFLRNEAQADVIGKLAKSEADERHAVVIATEDQFGPLECH